MTFDEKERSLQAEGTLHRRFYCALMGVDSLGNMDGGKVVGGWVVRILKFSPAAVAQGGG
jgi:hypothetical protein